MRESFKCPCCRATLAWDTEMTQPPTECPGCETHFHYLSDDPTPPSCPEADLPVSIFETSDDDRVILPDPINHPPHYNHGIIEPIDVIEDWKLPYHLGNAVKYIARAGHKTEDPREDLKKAAWYLNRYIEKEEIARANS